MSLLSSRRWTRNEALLALHLYWRLPFGQQHSSNREVQRLARVLDRTPSSIAMKLNNFTSLDPEERARGVKGLDGASKLDRQVWDEYAAKPVEMAAESEATWQAQLDDPPPGAPETAPDRTETETLRRVRLGQAFFRRVVLANFDTLCALTGINHPALVNASHIVAWAELEAHRVNPKNGIALNRLHDAAFDRKLITFDDDLRLVVGRRLKESMPREELASGFLAYEGRALKPRVKHELDAGLLGRHRDAFAVVNGEQAVRVFSK